MSIHTFLSNLGITKGRKIIIKSGAKANLTTETLDFAELGMTHEGELYVGAMDGSNILINANSTATLDDHTSKLASTVTLGHVKVGDNIKVTSGVISINNASTSQKGVVQIVDDLTTNDSTKVLSASMGKTLKDAIDTIGTVVNGGSLGGITLADIPDSSMTARGLMTSAQYIKLNGISSGANFTSVENVLTSSSATSALSAYQGKIVNDKITTHTGDSTIHVTPTEKSTWNGYGSRIHSLENSTANYTATVSTSWTGTSAPFTQSIPVSGITSTDNPIIFPIYNSNNNTAITEQETWLTIGKITTANNSITVTCFEEKPTTALNIQLKVVR